jgi:hypothetical protein
VNGYDLPTKIVITKAEIEELNKNNRLRGRSCPGCIDHNRHPNGVEYAGLKVFSGKKDDVIAWFREGGPGWKKDEDKDDWAYSTVYDILVSELLMSGDKEIIECLIRHAESTSGCVASDWHKAAMNPAFAIPLRLVAWARGYGLDGATEDAMVAAKGFWKAFDRDIKPSDFIAALKLWDEGLHKFYPELILDAFKAGAVTPERARALLWPTIMSAATQSRPGMATSK